MDQNQTGANLALAKPEVLGFILVSKTAKARRALRQDRREYEAVKGGYYRLRVSLYEQERMRQSKLTRLGLLHQIGVY